MNPNAMKAPIGVRLLWARGKRQNRWGRYNPVEYAKLRLTYRPSGASFTRERNCVAEGRMLDMSKYAEHFPDERQDVPSVQTAAASAPDALPPSPALLTALSQLEKEFTEILQAQQPDATDGSEQRPASAE